MFDWTQLSELGFLVDALPFPTWVTDTQGRCRWQNTASLRNWGSLTGLTIEDMSVPDDVRERWRDGQQRALRGEIVENLIEPKSATYSGYLGVVVPLRQGKEIIGTIGLRVDLDERFAALRQSTEKAGILEAVFQAARMSIGVREVRGDDVVHVLDNPVSAEQLGRTPEQTRGKTSRELGLSPWLVQRSIETFRQSRSANGPVHVEVPVRFPDESTRTYLMHLAPVPTEVTERYLVIAEDVTETRQLEASLQQADRLISLGTLTASVGHEIRNPLSYLQMTLAMMRDRIEREASKGPLDVAAMRRDVAVALEGTERIVSLVKDLQAFSRPSTDDPGEADLNAVVRSILALATADLRSTRVELGLGSLPPVAGSPVRLGQVVLNLLLNANRAAHESTGSAPGCIWIRTRKTSDAWIELIVGDNGPGISPEMREKLFTPFASGYAVSGGTGLGLYVVRQIVGALGGEISAADRPEGGAEFTVTLPIARSE
jgi:signal transduction histidine kinase